MNRRRVISSVVIAASLSGCASSLGSQRRTLRITTQPNLGRDDLAVSAAVENEHGTDHRTTLSLTVENTSSSELALAASPAKPFGVLELVWEDDRTTLWSDRYETSNLVETDGREVTLIRQAEPILRLERGESISQVYSIGDAESSRLPRDRPLAVQRDSSNGLTIDGTRFDVELSVSE